MSALSEIASALGPATQGYTGGLLSGREAQIKNAQLQQQLDTAAAAQRASEAFQQGSLKSEAENRKAARVQELDTILANPSVVSMLQVTQHGRKYLQSLLAERNQLDPTGAPALATSDFGLNTRSAAAYMLTELEDELQNPRLLLARGVDPKDVQKYHDTLAQKLGNPDVPDAALHALIFEHPRAAQSALDAVTGAGPTPPPGMPDLAQMFGFAPRSVGAALPPGAVSSSTGTQVPLPLPTIGVTGAMPDTVPRFNPAQFAPANYQAQSDQGDAVQTPGVDPQVIAQLKGIATAPVQSPQAPLNPVAELLRAGGLSLTPPAASQAFAQFNPLQQASQMAGRYDIPLPIAQDWTGAQQQQLGTQAQAQESLQFRPLQIIKAGLDAQKSQVDIQKDLASAGYDLARPQIDAAGKLLEAGAKGAELAQKRSEFAEKQGQDVVQNAQNAIRAEIQDKRAQLQSIQREVMTLFRADLASQDRVRQGTYQNAAGQTGAQLGLADIGSIRAGLSMTGGSSQSIQKGVQFRNTDEHQQYVDALHRMNLLQNSLPSFIPSSQKAALLSVSEVTPAEQGKMRQLVGDDGSNTAKLVQAVKQFSRGTEEDKANALRMLKVYGRTFPNNPLPISPSVITNPEGAALKKSLLSGQAKPAAGPAQTPTLPAIPGPAGELSRAASEAVSPFLQGLQEIIKRGGQPSSIQNPFGAGGY